MNTEMATQCAAIQEIDKGDIVEFFKSLFYGIIATIFVPSVASMSKKALERKIAEDEAHGLYDTPYKQEYIARYEP